MMIHTLSGRKLTPPPSECNIRRHHFRTLVSFAPTNAAASSERHPIYSTLHAILYSVYIRSFPRRSKISNNDILLVGVLLAAASPTKLEQVIDIARPGLSTTPHRGGPPHYSHPPTLKSYRATLLRCTIVAENSR